MKKDNGFIKLIAIVISIMMIVVGLSSCKYNNDNINEVNDKMICTVGLTPLTIEESKMLCPQFDKSAYYTDKLLMLQAAYLATLNCYLEREVDINKYQKILDDSKLNYPLNNPTIYSKVGSFGRKNISIRNIVFVDRLAKSDKDAFFKQIDGDSFTITEELIKIVEKTWREVITVKFDDTNESYEIIYDLESINGRMAMNDALVFEIKYDFEYDENGNIPDDDYEILKKEELFDLQVQMEKEISEKLDCNVTVFIKN